MNCKSGSIDYLNSAEHNRFVLEVNTTSHRIDDRFWLFEDLLLHERAVVSCDNNRFVRVLISLLAKKRWNRNLILFVLPFMIC